GLDATEDAVASYMMNSLMNPYSLFQGPRPQPPFSLTYQQARDRGFGSAPFGPPVGQQQFGQQQIAQQQMANQQVMMAQMAMGQQGGQQQLAQEQAQQQAAQQQAGQQQGGSSFNFGYGVVGAIAGGIAAGVTFVLLVVTSPGWVPIVIVVAIGAA